MDASLDSSESSLNLVDSRLPVFCTNYEVASFLSSVLQPVAEMIRSSSGVGCFSPLEGTERSMSFLGVGLP